MLTNPTIDMLRDLGLSGMASAYQELDTQPEAQAASSTANGSLLLLEREATARVARSASRPGLGPQTSP
jgi:hypothetical protein